MELSVGDISERSIPCSTKCPPFSFFLSCPSFSSLFPAIRFLPSRGPSSITAQFVYENFVPECGNACRFPRVETGLSLLGRKLFRRDMESIMTETVAVPSTGLIRSVTSSNEWLPKLLVQAPRNMICCGWIEVLCTTASVIGENGTGFLYRAGLAESLRSGLSCHIILPIIRLETIIDMLLIRDCAYKDRIQLLPRGNRQRKTDNMLRPQIICLQRFSASPSCTPGIGRLPTFEIWIKRKSESAI